MLSIDTNILLYAYSEAAPEHDRALAFITSQSKNKDVALSEFVLTEFATANVKDFEGFGFKKVWNPITAS